jgi:hypothetical protein
VVIDLASSLALSARDADWVADQTRRHPTRVQAWPAHPAAVTIGPARLLTKPASAFHLHGHSWNLVSCGSPNVWFMGRADDRVRPIAERATEEDFQASEATLFPCTRCQLKSGDRDLSPVSCLGNQALPVMRSPAAGVANRGRPARSTQCFQVA